MPTRLPHLFLVTAASLWSLSGAFAKLIALPGPTLAVYRAAFAGLILVPFVRPGRVRWRPALIGMVLCFTGMNLSFVTALTLTSAANAIFLQCTSPLWSFLACVFWLKEPLDRRSLLSVVVGLGGIAWIAGGGWAGSPLGISLALASGVFYGLLTVFLRYLKSEDALWLTALNHVSAAVLLSPLLLLPDGLLPWHLTSNQVLALAAFGIIQMGLPYLLYAQALRHVSPQEAAVVVLLEPVLNPIVTYFAVGEVPAFSTVGGGIVVLLAVGLRYIPWYPKSQSTTPVPMG